VCQEDRQGLVHILVALNERPDVPVGGLRMETISGGETKTLEQEGGTRNEKRRNQEESKNHSIYPLLY
jgi:hypothetical protein